jgi:hypothetical protein
VHEHPGAGHEILVPATIIDLPGTGRYSDQDEAPGTLRFAGPSADGLARADQLALLGERVRDYVVASKAPNTIRAYRTDWQAFTSCCDERALEALPAEPATVAAYLTDLAGVLAVATLLLVVGPGRPRANEDEGVAAGCARSLHGEGRSGAGARLTPDCACRRAP